MSGGGAGEEGADHGADLGGEPFVDPFAGVSLDESFVAAAVHKEASAAERARRPPPRPIPPVRGVRPRLRRRIRRTPPARRLTVVAVVLFLGLVACAVAVDHVRAPDPGAVAPPWESGDVGGWLGVAPDTEPPPGGSTARVRETVTADSEGDHDFVGRQEGSDDPVTWDPCRTVELVLLSTGLPAGAEDMLIDALADVSRLTGLDLRLEGTTDEVPRADRPAVQPDRYGDRWAPVLVAWTDPRTVPELAGAVAGMAGALPVAAPSGRQAYVTGTVLLDRADLADIEEEYGRRSAEAVVLHELGHLVGLAHVDDPTELMYPVGREELTTFGPGDREGLARLGQGPCVPTL